MIQHDRAVYTQTNQRQITAFGVAIGIPPHYPQKHAVQHDFEKPRYIVAEHPPPYRVALYLDAKLTHPIEREDVINDVQYVGE